MGDQMVFKRYELKYMLTKDQRDQIQELMKEHMVADKYGKNTILSLYLDTPDYLLIRRSLEKPTYKEKLRLRSYGVAKKDTEVFIELKKKYDSVVYKRREGMTEDELEEYLTTFTPDKDTQIMREIDYTMKRYPGLAPAMMLSYDREAFYAKDDHEFRMTFDDHILWRTEELSLCAPVYGMPLLEPNQVLLEVKTAGAIPLWLVHKFSELGIRQTSFSKYGSAYQTIFANNHRKIPMRGYAPVGNNIEQPNTLTGGNYQYA
jgi:SPX domain protein involved in polyphosphate accumulation